MPYKSKPGESGNGTRARGKFATFLLKKHFDGIIAYVIHDTKINSPRGKWKVKDREQI